MKIMLKLFFFVLIFSVTLNAQDEAKADAQLSEIINVYTNLEYNTIAFDDLKNKWIISDPMLVREVFNRFIVKNALRENHKELNVTEIRQKSLEIQGGNILIFLRKRYYDDEVEYFSFVPYSEIYKVNPDLLVDPVDDGFYLKEIIGNQLYKKIQDRSYFFSGVTKDVFEVRAGYYFDLNLNLIEPEVMFWSTTSANRNKYLISVFGKWGNDEIYYPGQFLRTYVGGLRLKYYDVISSEPDDYSYAISVGIGMASNNQYVSALPKNTTMFKSGSDIYFKLSGQPFEEIWPDFEHFFLDLEVDYNIFEHKFGDYKLNRTLNFHSIQNYFSLKISKKKMFDIFNLGLFKASLGISTNDMNYLKLDNNLRKVTDLEPNKEFVDKFNNFINAGIGIDKFGGLIQYDFNFNMGYNFTNSYMMAGVSAKFMLSDNFGLDLRYYQSLGVDNVKVPWRTDTYLVFSPILKINY